MLLMINIRFRKIKYFENRHIASKWWTHYIHLVLCESDSQNGDNYGQFFMRKSSSTETKTGSDDLSAGPL